MTDLDINKMRFTANALNNVILTGEQSCWQFHETDEDRFFVTVYRNGTIMYHSTQK